MSELNLTFFILLGYAQAHWFVITIYIIGALGLNNVAWTQKGRFFQSKLVEQTLMGFGVMFVLLFLTIPWLTGSSLFLMGYWLDWVLLFIMATGYSLASLVWMYPIIRFYHVFKPTETK
ncbi:MAG: glucose transporter [Thiomicrospira sp.]|uniref:glucose transporter n=1 Tax=Thiomicrospira sp. TaxID=935 RepID=UPI0019DCC0FA|nr:glucose transporter [Thiomicrospira sp.]MBE0493814.1 glucose transporter [Thiomicrospira sp.]